MSDRPNHSRRIAANRQVAGAVAQDLMRGPRYGLRIVKRNQMAAVYLFGLALPPSDLGITGRKVGCIT